MGELRSNRQSYAPHCCGSPMEYVKEVVADATDVGTRITSEVFECPDCRGRVGRPIRWAPLANTRANGRRRA